jgi:hypothetical protein
MGELVQLLIQIAEFAWPFRSVEQWERGVYYFFGKCWKTVGPGRWPVIPFFMDVRAVSMAPAIIGTPLLTITLSDNRTLTFSVAAVVKVERADDALNEIENYMETTQELLGARVAEKLAEVDAARIDATGRKRLLTDLTRWLDDETEAYGVRVTGLRFTNFAINLKTFRLLTDTALPALAW